MHTPLVQKKCVSVVGRNVVGQNFVNPTSDPRPVSESREKKIWKHLRKAEKGLKNTK